MNNQFQFHNIKMNLTALLACPAILPVKIDNVLLLQQSSSSKHIPLNIKTGQTEIWDAS